MRIKPSKLKLCYIALATIFLCWLLDFHIPVQAQVLKNYQDNLNQISAGSGGAGIVSIINIIFEGIRYSWFLIGVFIFSVAIYSSVFEGIRGSQIAVSFLMKSFMVLTLLNAAYALVQPIINRAMGI